MHTSIVFLHVAECFYKRCKLNVSINLYLSNRLCPFRFNFLTVQGIYAELRCTLEPFVVDALKNLD